MPDESWAISHSICESKFGTKMCMDRVQYLGGWHIIKAWDANERPDDCIQPQSGKELIWNRMSTAYIELLKGGARYRQEP